MTPPHLNPPLTALVRSPPQVRYLSLRPLLQPLQERRHVVVVVNGELHLLPHNADGNILKGSEAGGQPPAHVTPPLRPPLRPA